MRYFYCIVALVLLSACGGTAVWAPDEALKNVYYRHPGPATITLYTVRNEGTDNGAHTALLINASQRVLWDPAGSFGHEAIPERNDVIFGVNPAVLDFYNGFHSYGAFYVTAMEIEVEPEVAEDLLRRVMAYGPVGYAQCAINTSALLKETKGFESIDETWFPNNIMEKFSQLPNLKITHYKNPNNEPYVLRRWEG